jgi:hypothetical protein
MLDESDPSCEQTETKTVIEECNEEGAVEVTGVLW